MCCTIIHTESGQSRSNIQLLIPTLVAEINQFCKLLELYSQNHFCAFEVYKERKIPTRDNDDFRNIQEAKSQR